MNITKRLFSSVARVSQREPRSAVKLHFQKKEESTNFKKSFPVYEKKKPWDVQGITKDEFFGQKYAKMSTQRRDNFNEKVARQRRHRDERRESDREYYSKKTVHYQERLTVPKNPLSEYIYGTHAVLSALLANKRASFNTLYLQHNRKEAPPGILKLAKQYNLSIQDNVPKGTLNGLTGFGVHNGVVLESKPLEFPLISTLGPCNGQDGTYKLASIDELYNSVQELSKEVVKSKSTNQTNQVETEIETPRFPIGIYLDGVTDPQNVGAIIRSAYFMGVDFVVVPDSESAKLGPVCNKASAGALDMLSVYKTNSSLKFIESSKKNGWVVISTTGKLNKSEEKSLLSKHSELESLDDMIIHANELNNICQEAPVLLVMGSEGLGVRTNLFTRSDYLVGLEQGREDGSGIVDSLNASVATALLISKCLG
ncbi:rRNA methyltransferase 1, mitochondrial [[Candida] anglica]